jgi:hypothetical protein
MPSFLLDQRATDHSLQAPTSLFGTACAVEAPDCPSSDKAIRRACTRRIRHAEFIDAPKSSDSVMANRGRISGQVCPIAMKGTPHH